MISTAASDSSDIEHRITGERVPRSGVVAVQQQVQVTAEHADGAAAGEFVGCDRLGDSVERDDRGGDGEREPGAGDAAVRQRLPGLSHPRQ